MAIFDSEGQEIKFGSQPAAKAPTPAPTQPTGPLQGPFTQAAAAFTPPAEPESFLRGAVRQGTELAESVVAGAAKTFAPENLVPEGFYQPTKHPTAEAVGGFGMNFAAGLGAYSLGKAALTKTLGAISPRVAAYLAQTGAETIPLALPKLLRAGQAVGGAAGIGALETAQGVAEGKPLPEAAKEGGLAAGGTLALEGAAVGVAKLFGKRLPDYRKLYGTATEEQVAALGALDREVVAAQKVVGQKVRQIDQLQKMGVYRQPALLQDVAAATNEVTRLQGERAALAETSGAFSRDKARQEIAARFERSLAVDSAKLGERIQQLETRKMEAEIELGLMERQAQLTFGKTQLDLDIPLGVSRSPVIDSGLSTLDDAGFAAAKRTATAEVDKLETLYDAAPKLSGNRGFRTKLATAQDAFDAVENEQWRRDVMEWAPEELAFRMRRLGDTKEDKLRALLLIDAVKKRGIEAELTPFMQEYASRSADHAEVLAGKLSDWKKLVGDQAASVAGEASQLTAGGTGATSAKIVTPTQIARQKRSITHLGQKITNRRLLQEKKLNAQDLLGRVARGEAATAPSANFYLKDSPAGRKWLYGGVQMSERQHQEASLFLGKLLKSPDSVARSQGLSMGVLGNEAIEASQATTRRANQSAAEVKALFKDLADAMGKTQVGAHLSHKWERGIREAYETGGSRGVESKYGSEVAGVWDKLMQRVDAEMKDAERFAGALRMTPEELAANVGPAGAYFPQVPVPKDYVFRADPRVAAIMKSYASRGRTITADRAEQLLSKLDGNRRAGLKKVGNLDYERLVPGSTGDKVAAGWQMVDDPQAALEVYMTGLAHRIEYSKRFGPGLELVDSIKESARAEGANMALVHTAADLMTGATYFDAAFRDTARRVTSVQVLAKMGLAGIPNLSQQVNNILFGGVRNFTKGIAGLVRSSSRERVIEGMAAQEGILSIVEQAATTGGRDPLGLSVKALLNANAFSPVENLNRTFGGATAQAVAKDIIAKGLNGRLKGVTLTRARNQAASLGFDLSRVIQRGDNFTNGELEGILQTAVGRGIRETQFAPDASRIPYYWQHPYGKVMVQFKSFAFSQAKFIRDDVFREALEGNMKPLAYFLTLYPMAGEMVASTLDEIKGRPRQRAFDPTAPFTDLERYVETMASVGAFGIAANVYMGAKYDDLFSSLVGGPTVADVEDLAQAAVSKDPWAALGKKIEKLPSYRFGKLAFTPVMVGVDLLRGADQENSSVTPATPSTSIGELLLQETKNKSSSGGRGE